MAGKSSSSFEVVNWSPGAVCATSTLLFRNDLLAPKRTSVEEKLKFPCAVLTSKLTGPLAAEMVTMTPFSCSGPDDAEGPAGASRVDSFQPVVPVTVSVSENRQPRRFRMAAPVAVIVPSHVVPVVSPTPRITRYDCAAGDVRDAARGVTVG